MDWIAHWVGAAGDPVQVTVRIAALALAWLLAWVVISIPFAILYAALRNILEAAAKALASGVNFLKGAIVNSIGQIGDNFRALAHPDRLRVIVVDQIRALRKAARKSAREVRDLINRYDRLVGRAGGAGGQLVKRLQDVEANVDQLGSKLRIIKIKDLEELIKTHGGNAVPWFRAIFVTVFAIAIMGVNTLLLFTFFKDLIHFRIPYVTIPSGMIFAALYTFVELVFGIGLEIANEAHGKQKGIGFAQFVLCVFIFVAIATEVGLYVVMSAGIHWPWTGHAPAFLNGWLGGLGIIIGGGVAWAGYLMGNQWAAVLRGGEMLSLKRQAEFLNNKIKALPDQITAVHEAAQRATLTSGGERSPAADEFDKDAETTLAARLKDLAKRLEDLRAEYVSPVAPAHEADASGRRYLILGLAVATVVVGVCNAMFNANFLLRTSLADLGPYAAPAIAGVFALIAFICGRFATSAYQVGVANEDGGKLILTQHGGGVTQWLALGTAGVMLVVGAWAATSGFSQFSLGMILLSVTLNMGSFVLGGFLDDVLNGLWFLASAVLQSIWTLVLSIAISILGLLWVVAQVFPWAFKLIGYPMLWIYQTIAGMMSRGGHGRGGAERANSAAA